MSTKSTSTKSKTSSSSASIAATPAAAKPTVKATTSKKPASAKTKAEVKEEVAPPVVTDATDKKERKRREVNKETVDTDFTSMQTRIEAEISRLRESSEKVRGIKFLRSINKALKTLHSDTKRVMKLKKKNNRKKNVVSGFLKPIKISPELAAFTGWNANDTYSRVTVTKHICDYIKERELYDPNDKRLIMCDDQLKSLLKYDPENPPIDADGQPALLNYFRLQRYLKPHFIKIEDDKSKETAAEKKKTTKSKASSTKSKTTKKQVVEEEEEEDDVEEEAVDDE